MEEYPVDEITEGELDALIAYLEAAEAQWQATHPAWIAEKRRQHALEN
jgi:hypothetical protein